MIFRQNGGSYIYLQEAFGPIPAFLHLWMSVLISTPSKRAIGALTFANYIIKPFFPECQEPPKSALRMVGILFIVTLAWVNSRKVKWATRVQNTLALTKVLALIMIIVIGINYLAWGRTHNYRHIMVGTNWDPASIATAFYQSLYAYSGWGNVGLILEEIKDPTRNVPKAIAISFTSITVIYVLTNGAYLAVLTPSQMLSSAAVAVASITMMMFVTSDVVVLINYLSFSGSLVELGSMIAFFWFRIKQPDRHRPMKVWIGLPIIYFMVSVFLTVLPVVRQPLEVLVAVIVIITGLPVYYFTIHRQKKPQKLLQVMDKVEYLCQLVFLTVPEDKTV
nr:Y+L amino acid transporter 2-like isoform X2 [Cherax quadricarinatus]